MYIYMFDIIHTYGYIYIYICIIYCSCSSKSDYQLFQCPYVCAVVYKCVNIYIGGWRAGSNREVVLVRSCVCAQLYVSSDWISKLIPPLFPFDLEIPSLFPCETLPSPQSSYPTSVGISIYSYIQVIILVVIS